MKYVKIAGFLFLNMMFGILILVVLFSGYPFGTDVQFSESPDVKLLIIPLLINILVYMILLYFLYFKVFKNFLFGQGKKALGIFCISIWAVFLLLLLLVSIASSETSSTSFLLRIGNGSLNAPPALNELLKLSESRRQYICDSLNEGEGIWTTFSRGGVQMEFKGKLEVSKEKIEESGLCEFVDSDGDILSLIFSLAEAQAKSKALESPDKKYTIFCDLYKSNEKYKNEARKYCKLAASQEGYEAGIRELEYLNK